MKKLFPVLLGLILIPAAIRAQGKDSSAIVMPWPGCQASFYYYYNDSVMTFAEAYPYRFVDQSSGLIVSWHWDFGDGQESRERNPMHFYDHSGDTVKICLTTLTSDSCLSTFCMKLIVGESHPYDCHTEFVIATGKSLPPVYTFIPDSSRKGLSYWWDFGDGSFSTEATPDHRYDYGGYYTVCLQATEPDGCTSYVCQTLLAQGQTNQCKADWMAYPDMMVNQASGFVPVDSLPLGGRYVYFQDLSKGAVKSWHWEFGDGTTSEEPYPVHRYEKEGKYTVCLTIVTVDSCSSTRCDTLVIKPEAWCSLTGVVVDETGLDGCGLMIRLDNGEMLEPAIMPDFRLRPGMRVRLAYTELTDVATICMAGKVVQIDCIEEIESWPGLCDYFILLSTEVLLNGQECNGKATVSLVDINGNPVNAASTLWSTGETGNTVSDLCPGYSYSVLVTDISGCAVSGSFSFGNGVAYPDSLFGYWRYAQDDMTFDFSVPVYADSVVCLWDFGDGSNSEGENVNHTYGSQDEYIVILTVYDKQGNLLATQQIPVTPGAPTGIREQGEEPLIYPVPAGDILYVRLPQGLAPERIEILGANGALLITRIPDATNGAETCPVDISRLPSGFYMGRMIYAGGTPQPFRFVK